MENLTMYQKLFEDFKRLPKTDTSPTFLEICKYPRNRFEEVCSRILQFLFNPNAEHKLSDLWVSSLLDMIGYAPSYHPEDITVETEEYAEGKRIDLIIKSSSFVIAIENKITADLYNPLHVYRHYIKNKYKDQDIKFIVLSVKSFNDPASRKLLSQNEFNGYTYKELFDSVNKNLGGYITHCDQKYLSYMLDFMKTINNMENDNSKAEYDFFFENAETINLLIERYNKFNNNIRSRHIEEIGKIRECISRETQREWWAWQGWDLGIRFNDDSNCIGIEASYEATPKDICDKFHIYITTWKIKDWEPYKDEVIAEFKENILLDERADNRVYLHLPIILGNDTNQIIETLKNTYFRLKQIADKHRQNQ